MDNEQLRKEFEAWANSYLNTVKDKRYDGVTNCVFSLMFETWQAAAQSRDELIGKLQQENYELKREAKYAKMYEEMAKELTKENGQLLTFAAPYLGLKPFHGSCNKEQVIWAKTQEDANSLPAGRSIFSFVKQELSTQGYGE